MTTRPIEHLLQENETLRLRAEAAEDALRALSSGEADAVLVEAGGQSVYTLEAADQPYRLLIDQRPYAAAALTAEGVVIQCNRRFADLVQRPLSSLLGQPLSDFVTPDSRPVLETLLRDGQIAEIHRELTLQRRDGTTVTPSIRINAVRAGALGLCLILTDMTEQVHYQDLRRTQAALHAANERLDLAQQAGRVGTFEWNIRTGVMNWSGIKEELYGLPAGEFGGSYEDWKQAVHPDDRERADAERLQAIAERTGLDSEFRIVRPDGETRWIANKGKVFYDADGEPLRMLGVSIDVTDHKRAMDALRDADRRKNEFLATLAHELRNPLAPIRNAVQIIKTKGPAQPELIWSLAVLERQVGVLARLLEDLLDVSRISRSALELRTERVELAAVLDAALETSRPAIEGGGHELTVAIPAEPIPLEADAVRLAQVFANLLDNAAKYTEARGHVRLSAERRGDDVVVSVKDTGVGIAAETLPHIFDIFSQATPALVRSQIGLGIGLSLVKSLVELHGGSVEARSDGRGHGSEFVVRLPVAVNVRLPAPAVPAAGDATPDVLKRRVLIVDDNRDSADSLAMLLRIMGHEVATAYDGEQAIATAAASRPEVVLLDIGMPKVNGYDTCSRIRREPWGADMLLVALTGWGQEDDRRRTAEAGFNQHMVKPVDAGALLKLLDSLSSATMRSE